MLNKETEILFNEFVDLVFDANQKFNLTGFKTKQEIFKNLVEQTILCLLKINFNKLEIKTVVDGGSGNGCPGILIAIMYPYIEVTMVEANQKKANFLKQTATKLNLLNVKVVCNRLENLDPKTYTEKFDLAISRAVGSIATMNELFYRWIKVDKYICHLKSLNFKNELIEAKQFSDKLGLKLFKQIDVLDTVNFNVNILFQKVKPTTLK